MRLFKLAKFPTLTSSAATVISVAVISIVSGALLHPHFEMT